MSSRLIGSGGLFRVGGGSTSDKSKKDPKDCVVFEPQQWRATVCKHCFRLKSQHSSSGSAKDTPPRISTTKSPNTSTASLSNSSVADPIECANNTSSSNSSSPKERRKTSSPSSLKKLERTGSAGRNSPSASAVRAKRAEREATLKRVSSREKLDIDSCSNVLSKQRLERSDSAKSRSRSQSKDRSGSSTPTPRANRMDDKYVEELENDLFEMEDRYETAKQEREELEVELDKKLQFMNTLDTQLVEYRAKICTLEKRCAFLEQEILCYRERLQLPESEQSMVQTAAANDAAEKDARLSALAEENVDLRNRIDQIEELCQELMEENDSLKEELDGLKNEIDEMHDNFQDEDAESLRELQKDLEAANKTCRVLQFKLRKAERRFDQCEAERAEMEDKIRQLEDQLYGTEERDQMRGMEAELHMAKEVSVRLHDELEFVEEKRLRVEEENRQLKDELETSERDRIKCQNETDRMKIELDKLRSEMRYVENQLSPSDKTTLRPRLCQTREPSFEEEQVKRELDGSREREADLAEQLRFAQEEARVLKRKLNEAEEENDSLAIRMEKLAASKLRLESDSSDADDDSTDANTRLQIELYEQEASLLRKRVVSLERENEVLGGDLRLMTAQLAKLRANSPPKQNAQKSQQSVDGSNVKNTTKSASPISGSQIGDGVAIIVCQPPIALADRIQLLLEKVVPQALVENKEKKIQEQLQAALGRTRELETTVVQMKMQMRSLQTECDNLRRENEDVLRRVDKSKLVREKCDPEKASRLELLKQIDALEEEVEDLMLLIKRNDLTVQTLESNSKQRENDLVEQLSDFEEKERELSLTVEELLQKNSILSDLLEFVTSSRNAELESVNVNKKDDSQDEKTLNINERSNSTISALSGVSTGSDDVFSRERSGSEPVRSTIKKESDWEEKFSSRLRCLEQLLTEERRRVQAAELKLEQSAVHHKKEEDNSANARYEKDALTRELKEREYELEEREAQINELHNRLDQSRRMYDAMKMLLDERETESTNSHRSIGTTRPSSSLSDKKSNTNGDADTKSQLAVLQRDMHRMTLDLNRLEVERNRLIKDREILEEELKIREEHIFEQDDTIRKLQRQLQESFREIGRNNQEDQKHNENKTKEKVDREAQKNENMETIQRLRNETVELEKSVQSKSTALADAQQRLQTMECDMKELAQSICSRDNRIKEKDDLLATINQRLANREKEIIDMDNLLKQTIQKLTQAENEIKDLKAKMSDQDRELKSTSVKLDEMKINQKAQLEETNKFKDMFEKREKDFAMSSKEKEKELNEMKQQRDYLHKLKNPPNLVSLQKEVDKSRKEITRLTALLNQDHDVTNKKNNGSSQSATPLSDTIDPQTRARLKHLEQVERLFNQLTSVQVTMKIQIEAYQRDLEEFKHLYYQIKSKYEDKEYAWSRERCKLVTISKEQEDKSIVITNLRRSLQEARLQTADLEHKLFEQSQELSSLRSNMERERGELQSKINHLEDTNKMPKVLQRFAPKKTLQGDSSVDRERQEMRVRLNETEAKLARTSNELCEAEGRFIKERKNLLTEAEMERNRLEQQLDQLRMSATEVNELQRQCDKLHARLRSSEDQHERARRIWQEERMSLQYRSEECRLLLDQWLDRMHNAVEQVDHVSDKTSELQELPYVIENIIDEVMDYKQKLQDCQNTLKRVGSISTDDNNTIANRMSGSSAIHSSSALSMPPTSNPNRRARSVTPSGTAMGAPNGSLDWTGRGFLRAESPFRSKRGASPDVSIRKITNFPDPTMGFLIPSRTSSTESVNSNMNDSQSLTQTKTQAAKHSFMENYDRSIYGSQDQLCNKLQKIKSSTDEMESTTPSLRSFSVSSMSRGIYPFSVSTSNASQSGSTKSLFETSAAANTQSSLTNNRVLEQKPSSLSRNSFIASTGKIPPATTSTTGSTASVGVKDSMALTSSSSTSASSTDKRSVFAIGRSSSVDCGVSPRSDISSLSKSSKPSNPFQVQLKSIKNKSSSDNKGVKITPTSTTTVKGITSVFSKK